MSSPVNVEVNNGDLVFSIWIFMCWGDPDLWDAMINFLMK